MTIGVGSLFDVNMNKLILKHVMLNDQFDHESNPCLVESVPLETFFACIQDNVQKG